MRVYGYHGASSTDLDGFVLFISVSGLRSKLFGLTIRPGTIIALGVISMMICVVLIQTDVINGPKISL